MILKIVLLLISFMPPVPLSTIEQVKKEVTAYCGCEKCCGSYADGITASGYKLQEGSKVVAAPKNIPFGTKIYIPGYGLATVEDRGGAIKDNRIDVYFHTHKEALQWGRQISLVEMRG